MRYLIQARAVKGYERFMPGEAFLGSGEALSGLGFAKIFEDRSEAEVVVERLNRMEAKEKAHCPAWRSVFSVIEAPPQERITEAFEASKRRAAACFDNSWMRPNKSKSRK